MTPNCPPSPHPAPVDPKRLAAEGWTRRNVAAEPRLSEAVEMYEAMGWEVLQVPVLAEGAGDGGPASCTACFGADDLPERYQVIYTRPKPGAGDATEELF